jgi:iron complex outermembrane receptor protein
MAPLGESGQDRLTVIGDFANLLIRFPGPLTQAEYDTDRAAAAPPYVSRDERRFNRTGRMAATLEHAFDDRQSVTVSAFAEPKALQRSERNRYRDFTRFHVGGQAVWSLERDWRPGLVGRTSAGVDEALQDGAILFWNLTPEGTRGTTIRANKREAANSAGAFVQQSLTWQDRWALSTALRLDRLDYVSQDFLAPALDARKRFTRVTPKLSVSRFAGDHTVYASLGGGVEAPAFNEIDPPPPFDTATSFNPFLEAMHSTTLELGARGAFTNPAGAWRYDAAAYRIETTNDIVPWAGGAYFLTAGRSRRTGIESSLEWRPSARLSVRGSATLSRNTYQEYANDLGDFSGNRMPGLPEAVWSVATRTALVAGVALDLSAESASRMWADDANTVSAPGYTTCNAALDWTRRTAGTVTRVFVAGRNLLDAETVSSVFINPISDSPGGPLRYLEPGLPRQWNAGVSVRW